MKANENSKFKDDLVEDEFTMVPYFNVHTSILHYSFTEKNELTKALDFLNQVLILSHQDLGKIVRVDMEFLEKIEEKLELSNHKDHITTLLIVLDELDTDFFIFDRNI